MKIISQTADRMVLKDGNAAGVFLGIALVIAGAGVAFYAGPEFLVGVAVAVIGLAALFLSSSITVAIDKRGGQIIYMKKCLVGGNGAQYAVADILRIETRRQWQTRRMAPGRGRMTSPEQVLVLQSFIVFKDGRELPIDRASGGNTVSISRAVMSGSGKEAAIASQVAAFLGLPFEEIAPPSGGVIPPIGGIRF